jgi:hypothetical protein
MLGFGFFLLGEEGERRGSQLMEHLLHVHLAQRRKPRCTHLHTAIHSRRRHTHVYLLRRSWEQVRKGWLLPSC